VHDRVTGEVTTYCPLGTTMPDYKLGFSSNLTGAASRSTACSRAVQGFSVYNQPLQWATFQSYSGIMDQSGVPEKQKPVGYYDAALRRERSGAELALRGGRQLHQAA
jgi:hypothetical protein